MQNISMITKETTAPKHVATWRDRVAMGLMLLAAVGAFVSFISGIGDSVGAGSATQVVEIWRTYGFLIFTGLFVLLAFFPRRYPGIWELAILDKAALGVTGMILLRHNVFDALTILVADGTLAMIILISYVLTKGYRGWATLRTPEK